jgi:hypothetical protein
VELVGDQSGIRGREAACIEIEPSQVVLEVDAEPLASSSARLAVAIATGSVPMPCRQVFAATIVSKMIAWTPPSHGTFTKPTRSPPSRGADPAQAVPFVLSLPVVVKHAVSKGLRVECARSSSIAFPIRRARVSSVFAASVERTWSRVRCLVELQICRPYTLTRCLCSAFNRRRRGPRRLRVRR